MKKFLKKVLNFVESHTPIRFSKPITEEVNTEEVNTEEVNTEEVKLNNYSVNPEEAVKENSQENSDFVHTIDNEDELGDLLEDIQNDDVIEYNKEEHEETLAEDELLINTQCMTMEEPHIQQLEDEIDEPDKCDSPKLERDHNDYKNNMVLDDEGEPEHPKSITEIVIDDTPEDEFTDSIFGESEDRKPSEVEPEVTTHPKHPETRGRKSKVTKDIVARIVYLSKLKCRHSVDYISEDVGVSTTVVKKIRLEKGVRNRDLGKGYFTDVSRKTRVHISKETKEVIINDLLTMKVDDVAKKHKLSKSNIYQINRENGGNGRIKKMFTINEKVKMCFDIISGVAMEKTIEKYLFDRRCDNYLYYEENAHRIINRYIMKIFNEDHLRLTDVTEKLKIDSVLESSDGNFNKFTALLTDLVDNKILDYAFTYSVEHKEMFLETRDVFTMVRIIKFMIMKIINKELILPANIDTTVSKHCVGCVNITSDGLDSDNEEIKSCYVNPCDKA